ncbi:MAG: hypothetical protein AAF558_07065 [Verrucomicrobiota bacterium]
MIEFAQNGPLGLSNDSSSGGAAIIGIGSGAVNVVDQIRLSRENADQCYIIDTDEQTIRGSVVEEKFLLGKRNVRGMGCGGDVAIAQSLWKAQEFEVAEMLSGIEKAFVVVSLGGGTGSGCGPLLLKWMKENGIRSTVFAITPFDFEGSAKLEKSADAVALMRHYSDSVFTVSNNRCLHLPEAEKDIRVSLHEVNKSVAQLVENLRRMITEKGLSQLEWDDLKSLNDTDSPAVISLENCWAGTGFAEGEDRLASVIMQALQSPLLEDGCAWKYSDRAFAGLIGGEDFSMSEYQALIRALKDDLPDGFPIVSGALVDPQMTGKLQLTLLFSTSTPQEVSWNMKETKSETAKEPVPNGLFKPAAQTDESVRPEDEETVLIENLKNAEKEEESRETEEVTIAQEKISDEAIIEESMEEPIEEPGDGAELEIDLFSEDFDASDAQRYFIQQDELPLEKEVSRGRFEKSSPTIMDGQDLDQPTYQRMKIKIRL